MKLQGLGVIFAIIVLPITIVLSFYIQMQVDTVNLQTSYDSKIIDATYDAVAALEMNTANEDMSAVSDSLRSIIEASTNVFFNTLLTNFGMSNAARSKIESFIPGILYTLYDGYYIYAPTQTPEILKYGDYSQVNLSEPLVITDSYTTSVIHQVSWYEDNYFGTDREEVIQYFSSRNGQPIYTKDNQMYYRAKGSTGSGIVANANGLQFTTDTSADLYYKNDFILKSYMPYAAQYISGTTNVVINYTLDNYLNIEGSIGDLYYTKTGYLIDPDSVQVDSGTIKYREYDPDHPTVVSTVSGDIEIKNKYDRTVKDVNPFEATEPYDFDITKYNEQDIAEMVGSGNYSDIQITVTQKGRNKDGVFDASVANTSVTLKVDYAQYEREILEFFAGKEDSTNKPAGYRINIPYEDEYVNLARLKELKRLALEHYQEALASYDVAPDDTAKEELSDIANANLNLIRLVVPKIQMIEAVQYYLSNKVFSDWVYTNLGTLKESDIVETMTAADKKVFLNAVTSVSSSKNENLMIFRDLKQSNNTIFVKGQDTEIESSFLNHKDSVIRNSIQYNLNLSFTDYTYRTKGYVYELPLMDEAEWEKITRNVSVVSYVGGMPCGSKMYSTYAVVSSTNNEITANVDDLYYVLSDNYNDRVTEVHRIDCVKFVQQKQDGEISINTHSDTQAGLISLRSKEIKYDKIYNKNTDRTEYDNQNLMCYDCIVNNNIRFDVLGDDAVHDSVLNFNTLQTNTDLYREYTIAVGAQRQDIYKTNALTKSEGYKSLYSNDGTGREFKYENNNAYMTGTLITDGNIDINVSPNKLKELEIVIKNLRSDANSEVTANFDVFFERKFRIC